MNQLATIGHNEPPEADAISLRLTEAHDSLIKRRDALLDAGTRVPEAFQDDDAANKGADFIKQLTACAKNAEAERVNEKEPFLEGGRRVDGFFKQITEPLDALKKQVNVRLTAYQRKKAEEERRAREEAERKAREEAQRLEREAAERAAKLESDEDLDAAIAAEEAASQAKAGLATAERAADANAAELSRSRSAHGSVASLTTRWTFRDLDRAGLDLNALREHIPQAALEQAVRSFIKAGGRQLAGVEIYEEYDSVVR